LAGILLPETHQNMSVQPRILRPAIKPHKVAARIKPGDLLKKFIKAIFENGMLKIGIDTFRQDNRNVVGRPVFDSSDCLRQADLAALNAPRESAHAAFFIRCLSVGLGLAFCGLLLCGLLLLGRFVGSLKNSALDRDSYERILSHKKLDFRPRGGQTPSRVSKKRIFLEKQEAIFVQVK